MFTVSQVYLSCIHGTRSEDIHESIHHVPSILQHQGSPYVHDIYNMYTFTHRDVLNPKIHSLIIQNYSSRRLSYEDAVFDAFEALSTVIRQTVFFGMPMIFWHSFEHP